MNGNNKSKSGFGKWLAVVAIALVLIGLGAGGTIVTVSSHKTTAKTTNIPSTGNAVASKTTQYKLAACKAGTQQTIANASYVVGTDIAPGNYMIVSQPAGVDWTNISVYNSKDKWEKQGSPSVEQGNADTSLSPQNNEPTFATLRAGEYMMVDSDPAIFTCE